MCGRYSLTRKGDQVATLFKLDAPPKLAPRYNIAPTQPIGAVTLTSHTGKTQWRHFTWGLIPRWAKDVSIGARMINARSETASEKPAFRAAIKYRRCLLPADGFYEWQKRGGLKQPMHVTLADDTLFAFAGLWECWQGPDGSEIESATILTTGANEMLAEIHPRMPVILRPDDYDHWLDPAQQNPAAVTPMLRPLPAELVLARPVGCHVNNARHEGARCWQAPPKQTMFE